jgi:histidinol-phosphate/aromatic aminotransferase/cobyric acid decarboxylase-like protein
MLSKARWHKTLICNPNNPTGTICERESPVKIY